eukprot:5054659-Pleurochrysis_carterae.AAC.3
MCSQQLQGRTLTEELTPVTAARRLLTAVQATTMCTFCPFQNFDEIDLECEMKSRACDCFRGHICACKLHALKYCRFDNKIIAFARTSQQSLKGLSLVGIA